MRTRASLVMAAALLVIGGRAHAAEVVGTVAGAARPTVVALEREGAPVALPPGPRVVMDQKNLAFLPPVLPVVRGTTVEFSNSDDVQHNVFSPTSGADKFDLGTYGPGATRTVTFTAAGDVRVLCNIHMEMEAHILVLDTPWFATAGEGGRYRIADVPAGRYALRLWQGTWMPADRSIDVPASGSVTADVDRAR